MTRTATRPVASRTLRPGRAFAAALLAGVIALTGLLIAPVAHAAPMPTGPMRIALHKLEQPEAFGPPASGLELGPDALAATVPVPGATFTATRVPGIDPTTPEGQQTAAGLTLAAALHLIEASGKTSPESSGTTDAAGDTVLDVTGAGVFVVTETVTPAAYVDAAPFLVVLPMAHPAEGGWLTTVHVYPKNASIDVSITVDDAAAIGCGDEVTWRTRNAIPRQPALSRYVTQNLLASGVTLDDLTAVWVSLSGTAATPLLPGTDYTVVAMTTPGDTGFEVEFTAVGLTKLVSARAADPTAAVLVDYPTRVLTAGEHANEVRLFVNQAAPVADTTVTKFGALTVLVHERGDTANLMAGAEFQLYLSDADARAGRGAMTFSGTDRWRTSKAGTIVFECLRYSSFASGLDREPGDELHRPYYAAPVSYPDGWAGDREPLAGLVATVLPADGETLMFLVWKGVSPVQPIPGLPVTGGQLLGSVLLALALIVGGATVVLRRRRALGER